MSVNREQLKLTGVLPPVMAARAGTRGKLLHVMIVKDGGATPVAACGCHPTLRGQRQARNVKHSDRCDRNGCAQRWPTPTRRDR